MSQRELIYVKEAFTILYSKLIYKMRQDKQYDLHLNHLIARMRYIPRSLLTFICGHKLCFRGWRLNSMDRFSGRGQKSSSYKRSFFSSIFNWLIVPIKSDFSSIFFCLLRAKKWPHHLYNP